MTRDVGLLTCPALLIQEEQPATSLPTFEELVVTTHGKPSVRIYPTAFNRRTDWRQRLHWKQLTPLLATGVCLEPWVRDGDILWFDPAMKPLDQDLVACEIPVRARGVDSGPVTWVMCTKQFRSIGQHEFVVCNQGAEYAYYARDIRILGTIAAWRRLAWWRRPSMRHMRFGHPELLATQVRQAQRL